MTDVTFNGVALSTAVPEAIITDISRELLGERRDSWEYVPGRAGAWLFPEQPGDRTITIGVYLDGTDPASRRTAVNALAGWADSASAAKLVIDDEPDRYWVAKLTQPSDPLETLTGAVVELEFRAGPYAFASAISSHTWTAADNVAHTFSIPDQIEALPCFELTAGATLASFNLTANGETLSYATAVTSGNKVTVSSVAYMVTTGAHTDTELTGQYNPAAVSMAGVGGDFPTLVAGNNTVTVDTPAGQSMTVTVYWRRRYRG